jgi:hypothetical protein
VELVEDYISAQAYNQGVRRMVHPLAFVQDFA